MEHLSKAAREISWRVGGLTSVLVIITVVLAVILKGNIPDLWLHTGSIVWVILCSILVGYVAGSIAEEPLKLIGQAILHASPEANAEAPDTESSHVAKEFVKLMTYNVNQIASLQDNKILAEHKREATQAANILTHIPLPLFVFNNQQVVTFVSENGLTYTGVESSQLLGKSLFESVDLEFQTSFTLEEWIKDCVDNKATDTAYWRRVRVRVKNQEGALRHCDMAGYYSRDNPKGVEFIITMFDHSKAYNRDESNMNLIAMAVHELRNPLTSMRGYVEALQEELGGTLSGDPAIFLARAQSSLKQLTSFVNNILNMSKINENQLSLRLHEESIKKITDSVAEDMSIRAKSLGKNIVVDIPDNLPTVGADRTTMYEVLTNLIDNALKYSGSSETVKVTSSLTKDGLIETVVEDKGVGIPTAVLPTLFEKFHRNHRNQSNISGTGLGLYISRAIVSAHGGEIWVKSKESEGTRFGFTLKQYASLAEDEKNGNNTLTRTAHGWIKNHSLYRR